MMTRGFRNLLKKPLLRASVILACFHLGFCGSGQFDFSSLMLMTIPIVMTRMPRICFQVIAS